MATALAVGRSLTTVAESDSQAARLAADGVQASLTSSTATAAGADGLAVDGVVSGAEFESFAGDLLGDAALEAVAFSEVVTEGERVRWEAESGLFVKEVDGAGGFSVAGVRDRHVVVRRVVPDSEVARRVLGLDLLGDPIRAGGCGASGSE